MKAKKNKLSEGGLHVSLKETDLWEIKWKESTLSSFVSGSHNRIRTGTAGAQRCAMAENLGGTPDD